MRMACLLLLLAAIAGCTPCKHVAINAWSDGTDISRKPYCLVPGQDVVPGDIEYSRYAAYAMTVLERSGYSEAPFDKAEVVVTLSYGVGGRVRPYSYTEPYYADVNPRYMVSDPQRYTVMGSEGYPGILDNYIRYIKLAAYEKRQQGATGHQHWRLDVTSPGSGTDLRVVMPYMMAGACNYVGKDTGKVVRLTIWKTDPRYKLVARSQP